jgi:outer membrane lipoprotein-sorting protein
MYSMSPRIVIALAITVLAAPAVADDCTTVKSAMLHTGHTPHSVLVTKTDGQGKKTFTRQVQTLDNKYVQMPTGKWFAMNIAMKDLNDDLSGVQTCRRSGSESVGGDSAIVYDVHTNLEGSINDSRVWISSKNLILKSEGLVDGAHYTTAYDFSKVTPPPDAVSLGSK